MTNYIQRCAGASALVVAVAVLVWFAAQDAIAQAPFTPCASVTLASTDAGVVSDVGSEFGIGIGADCNKGGGDDDPTQRNSGGLVTFLPPEWIIPSAGDVPIGTKMGTFFSLAQLGLLNNPCNTILPIQFDLVNATIDTSDVITPPPAGTKDRLNILALDDDADGIINGVEQWPDYLTTLATVDNDWDMSKLRGRAMAANTVTVPGTSVILNFLLFEPGTKLSEFVDFDPVLGYPAVTILQDPTQAASSEDPVSDFCAPLEVNATTYGEADGHTLRTNPGSGTYYFTTFSAVLADADGDGIENALDTCPYDADPDVDPRTFVSMGPGDEDGDGIYDSCDPFPAVKSACTADSGISQTDEDCDGWMNRVDNCPLDDNFDQEDDDNDGIGDACDENRNVFPGTTRDGGFEYRCLITKVTIGDGTGTQGVDPSTVLPCDPNASTATPEPTAAPTPDASGNTPTAAPTGTGPVGTGVGPPSGIGSLAPTGSDVPLWAVIMAAIAVLGVAGGLGLATRRPR